VRDADGNGVRLYRDRPPERWPRTPDGCLTMNPRPLNLDRLMGELPSEGRAGEASVIGRGPRSL
jgi:catechol 2,3-dioxygenase